MIESRIKWRRDLPHLSCTSVAMYTYKSFNKIDFKINDYRLKGILFQRNYTACCLPINKVPKFLSRADNNP
jgi:hypothetical protein